MRERDEITDEDLPPSKSELKRQADRIFDLGKELTTLGPEALAKIPLPEEIVAAIADYRKIKSFGARKRQLMLIAKYLRAQDENTIRTAIGRACGNEKLATAALHKSEHIRDSLIADDSYLTKFIEEYPEADAQIIRQLVRNARKEKELNKPPKSARELYKTIYRFVMPQITLAAESGNKDEEK